ncbi:hypothetical protein HaLaN_13867 [Haematococcus lacustris]|uniref:Uncharacterized protein n=1 Tax=Haematococcus lacustris TaxID=44745 RepID=A0A699Z5A4_HAELA|nr:hypothetical protein HaLaN_13867 [Haematococcus lacustris]
MLPVALQCLDPVAAAAPVEKVVLAAMVDQNDNASPTCQFGSELSTLTRTLTTGLTYWLP